MQLIIYDPLHIQSLTRKRAHEIKLGERIQALPWGTSSDFEASLNKSSSRYVLLGLPEDIGVRANLGRGGAYSAWQPVLNTLLNAQSNDFLQGEELLVLGHVDFSTEMELVKNFNFHKEQDLKQAREIVAAIDDFVAPIISTIVKCGKEPIVVGGGHNNAYPNIKGAARGLQQSGKIKKAKINCINCDAHTDMRPLEGRHSGNGFTYAFANGFLNKYSVLPLHEIFNAASVINELKSHPDNVHFNFFESIFVREESTFKEALEEAIHFIQDNYTGLEIDIDIIQNIPSSAKTSSGISTLHARQYVHAVASTCKVAYFHIAEAAPVLSHIKTDLKTGKLVAYLITDYIKARNKYYDSAISG